MARAVYQPSAQSVYVAYQPAEADSPCCYEYVDVPRDAWDKMCDPDKGWQFFCEAVQDRYLHYEVGKARFELIFATGLSRGGVTASWGQPLALADVS